MHAEAITVAASQSVVAAISATAPLVMKAILTLMEAAKVILSLTLSCSCSCSLFIFLFYILCGGCQLPHQLIVEYIMQILTNVPTKIHAPSQENVTIFKEDIAALVLSVGVVIIKNLVRENAISTWH